MAKQYKSKSGKMQWKPSFREITEMERDGDGFCLACKNVQGGVEPDARRYKCDSCGAMKVYGAEELALMGLSY